MYALEVMLRQCSKQSLEEAFFYMCTRTKGHRGPLHQVEITIRSALSNTVMLGDGSKKSLEEAVVEMCVQKKWAQDRLYEVERTIRSALSKQKVKERRQQCDDRNSFSVVSWTPKDPDVAGKGTRLVVAGAEDRGRMRARTGLMAVDPDVINVIITYLARDKVKLQREFNIGNEVCLCIFSPCGNLILTSELHQHGSGELKLWSATSGDLVRVWYCTGYMNDCCFAPDGKTMVTSYVGGNGMLRLRDLESGDSYRTLEFPQDDTLADGMFVDVSSDGSHILSGSRDGTVMLWYSPMDGTGDWLEHTLVINGRCRCGSFSPNGALFLLGDGASLQLYDAGKNSMNYQLQHTLTGHCDAVTSCSFDQHGTSILSGSDDCTLKMWCTATGCLLRTLGGHTDLVTSCAFSPDGLTIVSGSDDATLRLWTAATGRIKQIVDTDFGIATSCCFCHDGKYILSSHTDGSVKFWDVPEEHTKC